jgi:hypothetical protein
MVCHKAVEKRCTWSLAGYPSMRMCSSSFWAFRKNYEVWQSSLICPASPLSWWGYPQLFGRAFSMCNSHCATQFANRLRLMLTLVRFFATWTWFMKNEIWEMPSFKALLIGHEPMANSHCLWPFLPVVCPSWQLMTAIISVRTNASERKLRTIEFHVC